MENKKSNNPRGRPKNPNRVYVKLRSAWGRAKCQARYRGEEWTLTFEEFYELWTENDNHLYKGVHSEDLCMTRLDLDSAWELANVEIATRQVSKSRAARERGFGNHGL